MVLDGQTGVPVLAPPIPSSSYKDFTGTIMWGYSPIGPPMVAPDGSAYVAYEVRHIDYPAVVTSAVLWLMRIELDGTTRTTEVASTTNNENLFPARIIPDGEDGLLVTWRVSPSTGPLPEFPFHVARVSDSGDVVASYTLPFSPQQFEGGLTNNPLLVLGEAGTAFASYEGELVSFDAASGSVNWTYSAAPNKMSIVASTADNGVVATTRLDPEGNESVVHLAADGTATMESWVGRDLDHYLLDQWFTTSTSLQSQTAADRAQHLGAEPTNAGW